MEGLCSKCGVKVESSWKFCPNCGIEGAEPIQVREVRQKAEPAEHEKAPARGAFAGLFFGM